MTTKTPTLFVVLLWIFGPLYGCHLKIWRLLSNMNVDDLGYQVNSIANETKDLLNVQSGTCKILLHQYKWNRVDLIDRYIDVGQNTDEFFQSHRVANPSTDVLWRETECTICMDQKQCVGLETCGHLYCEECWLSYIESGIVEEQNWMLTCPAHECSIILHEEFVLSISPNIRSNLLNVQISSFVLTSPLLAWCPAPDCNRIVLIPDSNSPQRPTSVTCLCGIEFCPGCQQESHAPALCDQLRQWAELIKVKGNQRMTEKWLSINSKRCPQCTMHIEKNQGCDHMTCRMRSCRHEFCWKCMRPWSGHSSTECEEHIRRQRNLIEHLQENANRFIDIHPNSTGILYDATAQLKDTNKLLLFSTIYSYFLSVHNALAANRFESTVNQLELVYGDLQSLLVQPVGDSDALNWIRNVQDTTIRSREMCEMVLHEVPDIEEPNSIVHSMFLSVCSYLYNFITRIYNVVQTRLSKLFGH